MISANKRIKCTLMPVSKKSLYPKICCISYLTLIVLIDTRLADQTATSRSTQTPPSKEQDSGGGGGKEPNLITSLRTDLRTTQTARSTLETRLLTLTADLSAQQLAAKTSAAEILVLKNRNVELERRGRDLEEELRGKDKLVQDAQDEMVALELMLNLKEERCKGLERENGELVERWVRRMGEVVERVNWENERGSDRRER